MKHCLPTTLNRVKDAIWYGLDLYDKPLSRDPIKNKQTNKQTGKQKPWDAHISVTTTE